MRRIARIDIALTALAVGANLGARMSTAVALASGAVEMNPFALSAGWFLSPVLVFATCALLMLVPKPYREIALSILSGELLADFAHDALSLFLADGFFVFYASVLCAVAPLTGTSLYIALKSDWREV